MTRVSGRGLLAISMSLLVACASPVAARSDCDQILRKPDGTRFQMLFAQSGGTASELAALCLERTPILTTGWFAWPGSNRIGSPDVGRATDAGRQNAGHPLIVINIEEWKTWAVSDSVVMDSVQKLRTVTQAVKSGAPGSVVGIYSMVPSFNYWDAIQSTSSPRYQRWQRVNDKLQGLADEVEAFFPSVYTYYREDYSRWRKYALANIAESRRMGPNKPIYPFITDRYHPSNKELNNAFVEAEFIAYQIEALLNAPDADGVVIWRPMKERWNSSSTLVQGLELFLQSRAVAARQR